MIKMTKQPPIPFEDRGFSFCFLFKMPRNVDVAGFFSFRFLAHPFATRPILNKTSFRSAVCTKCAPTLKFYGVFQVFYAVKTAINKDSWFSRLLQNSSKMRRVGIKPTPFGLEEQCSIRLRYGTGTY